MSEVVELWRPPYLRCCAGIADREGDADTARIFRACAAEIERLEARVRTLEGSIAEMSMAYGRQLEQPR